MTKHFIFCSDMLALFILVPTVKAMYGSDLTIEVKRGVKRTLLATN